MHQSYTELIILCLYHICFAVIHQSNSWHVYKLENLHFYQLVKAQKKQKAHLGMNGLSSVLLVILQAVVS